MKLVHYLFAKLDRAAVLDHIEQEVAFKSQYFLMLFLSVVIATLGLIINNNAIIIGAMLLSPLLWPIIGIAMATVRRTRHLFRRSVLMLVVSLAIIIVASWIISFLSPFQELGSEITARTAPTLFDLVIALAAGAAGTLILTWPKFSDSLAGVAIAASLLPPICVTGICLAFAQWDLAYGSFVLFLTNLASIIFAGIIVFSIAKFYRRDDEDLGIRLGLGLFLSVLVIMWVGGQLLFSLRQIVQEKNITAVARTILQQSLNDISHEITLDTLQIEYFANQEVVPIRADIRIPNNIVITVNQKNKIVGELSKNLDRQVNLVMRITQTVEAITPDLAEQERQQLLRKAEYAITKYVDEVNDKIQVKSIDLEILAGEQLAYVVRSTWQVPEGGEVDFYKKQELLAKLNEIFEQPVDLELALVPYVMVQQPIDLAENPEQNIEFTSRLIEEQATIYVQSLEQRSQIRFVYADAYYEMRDDTYSLHIGIQHQKSQSIPDEYVDGLRKNLEKVFYPVEALKITFDRFEFLSTPI